MTEVCPKRDCTGCYACMNVCPKKAIKLIEDENGFVYPHIDSNKCVNCGLCQKICEQRKNYFNNSIECYSSFSNDDYVHKNSSSGGLAYELAKKVITNNGVVYGVSSYFDADKDISVCRIDSVDNLTKIQGSKYVHAYVKENYKLVLNDLKNNLMVLYIGTPCQVAGLKSFLRKDYENLVTIDIICHGVMSQKNMLNEINKDVDFVSFRGRDGYTLTAKKNNKLIFKKNKYLSDYYYSFLSGFGYRMNCYSCMFAQRKRVGDITLGDFWGKKEYKKMNGISVVLLNTKKGQGFFEQIDNVFKQKEELEFAYVDNHQLSFPPKFHDDYDKFIANCNTIGIKYALKQKLGLKKYYIIKIKGLLKKIKDVI